MHFFSSGGIPQAESYPLIWTITAGVAVKFLESNLSVIDCSAPAISITESISYSFTYIIDPESTDNISSIDLPQYTIINK